MTENIVEFIDARLSDDEAAAREQIAIDRMFRDDEDMDVAYGWVMYAHDRASGGEATLTNSPGGAPSPDHVLRQVEALRTLVNAHVSYYGAGNDESFPVPTLNAIARIWSDHPDFRDEWVG